MVHYVHLCLMSFYFYRKKAASKKVVHKVAEVTGEFLRNRFTDKFVKPIKEIIIKRFNCVEVCHINIG